MSYHDLSLGSLHLIGTDESAFNIETIAEGMDFGSAQPQDVVTQTLLQDGASVTTERWDNREITFGVLISGADLIAVAEGEAALYAELGRRNVLTWTPPDGWGPPSVFDVLTSWAEFEFDDWGEMKPATIGRRFVIRLSCAPFARSLEEIEVPAIGGGVAPPTPTPVVVDDCTSTSGWTKATNPVGTGAYGPTAASGAITAGYVWTVPAGTPPSSIATTTTLTRSGLSSPMSSTPLLMVQVDNAGTTSSLAALSLPTYTFKINGVAALPIGQAGDVYYFDCTSIVTLASVEVTMAIKLNPRGSFTTKLRVLDITRTDAAPSIGSGRQLFRSLTVQGSARTQGSILVEHETSSLGEVLVYTNAASQASGYQPACTSGGYRTTGGSRIPDSTAASGGYAALNTGTPETFQVPSGVLPAGGYSLIARIRGDANEITAVNYTVATLVGSTAYASESAGLLLAGGTSTAWRLYDLGAVTLPPDDLPPGSTQKVRIQVTSGNTLYLDELYLFNTDIGNLTWVDCGSASPSLGGSSNRLWLDTATLDRPREAIWMGTSADGLDRRHALGSEVRSLGTHVLAPGDLNLFTLTSNALNAAASARYYPRWPNNAGLIAA